jgi:hypothetical protein
MQPTTIGNMRQQDVQSLFVYCNGCHHQTVLNVDSFGDDVTVPSFGPRMRCQRCGVVGADVRPNWNERTAVGVFDGRR